MKDSEDNEKLQLSKKGLWLGLIAYFVLIIIIIIFI